MSVIFAIFLFSVLIFVHELGHFTAAKLSGVQVNEFSMFMGPAIWKKQVGETLYAIRCIPIGGYCAMEGEDGGSDNPRSFDKAAWWKRLIILAAGAAMNFLIGVGLMVIVCLPVKQTLVPVIASFEDYATVNGENGLQAGDRIVEVDGEKLYSYSDFSMILSLNPGDVHDITVRRNGEKVVLPVEKDDTDTHYAVRYALDRGADEIVIVGGIGGAREDHTFANIATLRYIYSRGAKGYIITDRARIDYLENGTLTLPAEEKNVNVTVFPLTETALVTERGLKYSVEKTEFFADVPLWASNSTLPDTEATITVHAGKVVIFRIK